MSIKTLRYLFLLVILLGLADSLYLAITTFLDISPVCGPAHGCDVVQTSSYSRVLGIPFSYLAVVYYVAGAIIGPSLETSAFMSKAAVVFGALGVVVGVWSVYLQVFVIHAFCLYCSALDVFALVLFSIATVLAQRFRQREF